MNSPIEQLPSEALLNRCAESWGLRNLAFVRKMENIVFACDSDFGKVYLRLTTPLRRCRPEIEAEIHWIEHLEKCGLKVPRLIPDKKGNKIASFTEGEHHYEAVVFSAVAGEHPSKEIASDPTFLKTLGSLIAKMHEAFQNYDEAHLGMKREQWDEERGLRHALKGAAASKSTALRDRLHAAISWMHQLPRTKETYGLIHADLGALNLFVEDDSSISIIDFDDSCYHWFIFDLAIVLFSLIGMFDFTASPLEEKQWLAELVSGYRTVRPLSEEQIALIPKLLEFACLRLFFWTEHHQLLNTFHENALERVAKTKQRIRDRIS